MAILFQTQNIDFKLKGQLSLKRWIRNIIQLEKKTPGEISFTFMDDASLLTNNIKFLEHDTLTDIITFDYCEKNKVNGDILISIERVKENANKFKVDFENELQRVMIHGILHLCGYKDKKKSDRVLMRKKEDWALRKLIA